MAYCYVCQAAFSRAHDCTDSGKCPTCGQPGNVKPPHYKPTEVERVMEEPGTASFCRVCGKHFSAFFGDDGALRCPGCGMDSNAKTIRLEGIEGFEGTYIVKSQEYDPATDTTKMVLVRKGS